MKKTILLLATLIMTISILTACGETKNLTGKYYYEDDSGINMEQYLEFSPDGNPDTLTLKNASGQGPFLYYKIKGDKIEISQYSFSGVDSETYSFSQQGNSIYFNGMKFTKK